MTGPKIDWIVVDPKKHAVHTDGSVYLLAIEVLSKSVLARIEYTVVHVRADDSMDLTFECGCPYDAWTFEDATWFALLSGDMPTAEKELET